MLRFFLSAGALVLVLQVNGAPLSAETVALWLFDDPPESQIASDASGHDYHLTLGADARIVADGKFGGALDADAAPEDGLGAFRYRAEKPLNPDDEDWTLECWLKAKPGMRADNRVWGLSGVNYIDYGRGDNPQGLYVASRFLPIDDVNGWNRPTGNLQGDDQYHHFAVVYDSQRKELRHYWDGEHKYTAKGAWQDVPMGDPEIVEQVFPPHYPMLQIGMRDALQQWDHREIHQHDRHLKKFQGLIDEIRFSDEVRYGGNFKPPGSFAQPRLHTWPQQFSFVVVKDKTDGDRQALVVSQPANGAKVKIESKVNWLTAAIGRSDTTSQSFDVTVDASRLTIGRHSSELSIASSGVPPISVPVTLTVTQSKDVIDVSDQKQLFIDNRFIDQQQNVELHINPAQKIGTDFAGSHYPRNIVYLEKEKIWRMYFSPWAALEHAESTDGIHWTKAGPGHIGYDSEKEPGKLIPLTFSSTVILDPVDVPERRFKAFQEVTEGMLDANQFELSDSERGKEKRALIGVYAFYSADGLRFKKAGRVLPILPEFVSFAPAWDPNIGKYVAFFRCQNTLAKGIKGIQGNQFVYHHGFSHENPNGLVTIVAPETMKVSGYENLRSVARIETDDLLKPWPVSLSAEQETVYATANQVPMVATADAWDGFADFYVHATTVYPYAQNVYLMFPTFFRHLHPSRQPYFHGFDDANGPLETTLAVSRDGIHWDRVDRKPYVPMGRTDEWDRWRTMTGVGMVRVGGDLYQFYWGGGDLHDSLPLRPELKREPNDPKWHNGMGILKQRLDGFVSADVDYRGGSITTPPLSFTGNRLELNHCSGGQGTIFVELRDLNDKPIPGFTLGDCEEISCDDVAWQVRWRGSADLSALKGQPVKIHFKMRNAKLYAFQFVDE